MEPHANADYTVGPSLELTLKEDRFNPKLVVTDSNTKEVLIEMDHLALDHFRERLDQLVTESKTN